MFNRPEMIPSQRMIRQTPLERLEQMRATAPNAQEAEALLRCLVVLQSPLIRKTIAAMAQPDMDEGTRRNAFMTLRYWSLVQKVTRHTYRIPESIKRLYPPSQELMARLLLYLSKLNRFTWDGTFIQRYWRDLSSAVLWGLENQPDQVLKLLTNMKMRFRSPQVMQEWPFYLFKILETARAIEDKALEAFALYDLGDMAYQEEAYTSADKWYAQAQPLYIELHDENKLASLFLIRGQIAHHYTDNPTAAREFYAQAMPLYLRSESIPWTLLYEMFDLEVKQADVERASKVLERLLPIAPLWSQMWLLFKFGQLLHRTADYEGARDAFARTLQIAGSDNRMWSNVLQVWAKMEYALGNLEAGRNLCRLALIHSSYLSEHHFQNEKEYWQEFVAIRTMLADMGCNEESQYE